MTKHRISTKKGIIPEIISTLAKPSLIYMAWDWLKACLGSPKKSSP